MLGGGGRRQGSPVQCGRKQPIGLSTQRPVKMPQACIVVADAAVALFRIGLGLPGRTFRRLRRNLYLDSADLENVEVGPGG